MFGSLEEGSTWIGLKIKEDTDGIEKVYTYEETFLGKASEFESNAFNAKKGPYVHTEPSYTLHNFSDFLPAAMICQYI